MMGFYWWNDRQRGAESQRHRGLRGETEYVPLSEDAGFWKNYGREVLASLAIFAASTFILVYGWNRGLALGGTFYFAFVLMAVVLSAVWPGFSYARWRRMQRIVERLTSPGIPPEEGRRTLASLARRRRRGGLAIAAIFAVTALAVVAVALLALWRGGPATEWRSRRFVTVPAGAFAMGSRFGEPGSMPEEAQHLVRLTRAFLIQTTEVREDDLAALLGYDPMVPGHRLMPGRSAGRCSPGCPARSVTWHEAAVYCNALSAAEGRRPCYQCRGEGYAVRCQPNPLFTAPGDCPGYRLPTEAEWEYVARAGTTTSTYNGQLTYPQLSKQGANPVLDPIAWWSGNSGLGTKAVATRRPNALGLHDLLGNVSEWCHDWFGPYEAEAVVDPSGPPRGEERVFRGGNAGSPARALRVAARSKAPPEARSPSLGFRPVRSL